MKDKLFILAVTCTLFLACTCGHNKAVTSDDVSRSLPVDTAVIYNQDSVLMYARRAYLLEDPKGLYVIGVMARLREAGELPDSLYAVSVDEGDILLLRSAQLGYPDALEVINILEAQGRWNHSIPENIK